MQRPDSLSRLLIGIVAGLTVASAAIAQDYPTRAIRIISPVPAGGLSDVALRPMALELQRRLGQPVIVENRAGANTMLAGRACAQAAPDGYTICNLFNDTILNAPFLFKTVGYDPRKDFVPITNGYFITGDIGGSYGLRGSVYPEIILMLWAARRVGRPVKWTSTRNEAHISDDDARDNIVDAALALDRDGKFLAVRIRSFGNLGAFVSFRGAMPPVVNIGTVMLKRPAPALDEATLDSVEHELARFLGPMAKVIVHKAAAVSRDRAELCSILSENLDDPDTRRKFVEAVNRTLTAAQRSATQAAQSSRATAHTSAAPRTTTGSGVLRTSAAPPLDDAFIDQVTAKLAMRIGPIARVISRKAAQQARTRSEFVHRIADQLDADAQAAFLRDVGEPRV